MDFGTTLLIMFMNLSFGSVAISIGIVAMWLAWKLFDRITPKNTGKILVQNPIAVAIAVAGIFIGVGICSGLIIGLVSS